MLCLLLAPVVLLAGPGAPGASAATAVGEGKAVAWEWDGWLPGVWFDCKLTAFYVVEEIGGTYFQQVKSAGGDCSSGTGVTVEDMTVWATGTDSTGTECASGSESSGQSASIGAEETFSFVLDFPGSGGSGAEDGLCTVTRICAAIYDRKWGNDSGGVVCDEVNMGAPPIPGATVGGCPHLAPSGIDVTTRLTNTDPFYNGRFWALKLALRDGSLVTGNVQWAIAPVIANGGTYIRDWPYPDDARYRFFNTTNGVNAGSTERTVDGSDPGRYSNGTNGTIGQFWPDSIVGVQLYPSTLLTGTTTGPQGVQGHNESLVANATNPTGMLGRTVPGKCIFYFGEKIASLAGSTEDEPAGALDLPEAPDPVHEEPTGPDGTSAACTFSATDPGTWLEGGMCAAVGLLGGILNLLRQLLTAVANLAGNIASALGSILEALLVPDADSWDFETLQAQLESKPPASVVGELGDGLSAGFAGFGSATCGGNIAEVNEGGSVRALLPCSGPSVTGWSTLYGLASLGIVIGTGLAIWSILGASIRKGA